VSCHQPGRHRAPSHLRSVSSLSSAISRSAKPAGKASAVIVISGAMVASLTLPASAATPTVRLTATAPVAVAVAVAPPSAAQAPLVPRTFGSIGFTGVVKPKPVVVPVVVQPAVVAVSRSITRAPITRAPITRAPITRAPITRAPITRAPITRAPITRAPITPTQSAPVAPPAPSTGGVIGIAASLAGIPYVYGGTTTAGFDCSGYTQYVFAKLGITLPRTAEDQRQAVTAVSNPQPGDLVFFGSPASHVGIYAGNNMMWNSPHSGAVVALQSIWSSTVTYGRP
jgi:cell wall-associated NlpC family hydrolase